jgi:outer membrane protein assembly factor BamB
MLTALLKKSASYLTILLAFLFSLTSCEKENTVLKNHDKTIISFSLKKADGTPFDLSQIKVSIQDSNILVTLPFNTDLSRLTPTIEITGVKISPASGVPQNFTTPVMYTVTAEDGSTARYTVTVKTENPESIVYIGSSDNNFYALDALTGQLKWKYAGTASFAYSSATYANGTVYVGGIDNYVYAFDALTGTVKWKFQAGTTGVESDAVVVDGTVYVGSNDDYLYALDALTGQLKWKYRTGANVSSSPTLSNGIVYFGSSDGKLYALYAATGQLKWSYTTGAMLNQSGPALYNGVVYVGSRDGFLYAINTSDGSL